MATATTQRKNMIGRLKKNKHAARAARTKEKILYRPLQNNNAKFKSQCRNISRISNQFRKTKFWLIPPKHSFDITISRNDMKKTPSALHLENFRKVRKFATKYNFIH